MALPTACKSQFCGEHSVERGYCAKHAKENPQLQTRFGLNASWSHWYKERFWCHPIQGMRRFILNRDPICVECNKRAAVIADHVVDHRGDWKLFSDPDNIRGICKPCHDKKTGSQHGTNRKPEPPPVLRGNIISGGV